MAQYETSLVAPELQGIEDSPESVTDDRRRPGRPNQVSPTLIPLLRTTPAPDLPPEDNADLAQDYEELAPAAAIAAIVLVSTLLWGAIGFMGWAIIR